MHLRMIHPLHTRHFGKREHILVSVLLRDFAQGLVDFFIPILLLIEGYDLYLIGFYYMLNGVARMLTHFATPQIMGSVGIQNTLRLSSIMAMPYIIGINYVGEFTTLLPIIAVYSGVMQSLYWGSRHIDMINVLKGKTSAQQVGNLEIAGSIMRIIAPFAGGLIAQYISAEALYGVVFGVLLSSALILTQDADKERKHQLPKIDLPKAFKRSNSRYFVANFAVNYQVQASTYVWPLVIYLTVSNIGTIGGVFAFGNLVYLGLVYLSTHSTHRLRYFVSGITIRIASFVLRVVANTPVQLYAADTTGALGHGMFLSLYVDAYYNQARKDEDAYANVLAKEIVGDIGKFAMWTMFTLATFNYSADAAFDLIFFIGIPMLGLTFLMIPPQKQRY